MAEAWARSSDTYGSHVGEGFSRATVYAPKSPFDAITEAPTRAAGASPAQAMAVDTRFHRYRNHAADVRSLPLGDVSNPGAHGSGIAHGPTGISAAQGATRNSLRVYGTEHADKDTRSTLSPSAGGLISNNARGFGEGLTRPKTAEERYGARAGESLVVSPEGVSHGARQSEFGFHYMPHKKEYPQAKFNSGTHPSHSHFAGGTMTTTQEQPMLQHQAGYDNTISDSMAASSLVPTDRAKHRDYWHSSAHYEKDTKDNFVGGSVVVSPKAKEVDYWHSTLHAERDTADNLTSGLVPNEGAKQENYWHGASNETGTTYQSKLFGDDKGFGSPDDPCPSHPLKDL